MSEFSKNVVECMHRCVWPSVDQGGVVGGGQLVPKQTDSLFFSDGLCDETCVTCFELSALLFTSFFFFPVVETSDSSALHFLSSIASAAEAQDGPACCNCFPLDAVAVA